MVGALLLLLPQVRQFKPRVVAIRDASKVAALKELIKDVNPQPEILVGDEGAVEVRRRQQGVAGAQRAAGARRRAGGCKLQGGGHSAQHARAAACSRPAAAAPLPLRLQVARHPEAEAVVTGIVGCAGLLPTVAAIKAGKDICLANKETLIAGGPFVLPLAQQYGVNILPADSEHSAIFQVMQGLPEGGLRR